MKSDVGHRKYVLVKDMASRSDTGLSGGPSEMIEGIEENCVERCSVL